MNYNIKIIKKEGQKINNWSGGKTTQLYIYPENSTYEKQNFKWRISYDTIEVDKSNLDKLPNIERNLMLEYENEKKVNLNEFDSHYFNEDIKILSYGVKNKFNLMTNNDCIGMLEYIKVKSNIDLDFNFLDKNYKYKFICIYSLNNNFDIEIKNKKNINIEKEEVLIIKVKQNEANKIKIVNKEEKELQIMKSIIYL